MTRRKGYKGTARRVWPRAIWVHGQGPYAVVAYCKQTTVTLHASLEDAQASRGFIDRTGCGHRCHRAHRVIDLDDLVGAA